jgi:hypothetical protein
LIGSGGGDGSRIYAAGKEDRVVVRMLVVMKTIIIAKAFAMVVGSAIAAFLRSAAFGKEDRVVVRMLVATTTRIIAKAFAMVVGSAIIIIITQRLFSAIAAFLTSAASRKVDRPVVQVLVVMRTRITAKLL